MKTSLRVLLSAITFLATYFLVYWVPFSLIAGLRDTGILPSVMSFFVAIGIAFMIWKLTGKISNSLANYILMGGVIVGATAFLIGFLGPLIFYPDSNQGPLLGIFITGPLGFVAGLIGGGFIWMARQKKA